MGKVAVHHDGHESAYVSIPSVPSSLILYIQCRARVPIPYCLSFPNDGHISTALVLGPCPTHTPKPHLLHHYPRSLGVKAVLTLALH
jgi:hypothetical protein